MKWISLSDRLTFFTFLTHSIQFLTSNSSFRLNYIFVIGKGLKPFISLPKGKGVRLSAAEERDKRLANKTN